MVNCFAIGINRYQFFQPLNYAQADAQTLKKFWLEETDLSEQDCLLMTESAAWIRDQSTYPNRENIQTWLQQLKQDDNLKNIFWFFFSGYGLTWEGQDYLMPIDGDPDDIPGTGISVQEVFSSLQKQGVENIFAVLDISRSPGIVTDEPVGTQTLKLSQKMGITTLLSSQVGEFSYEASALGHGILTSALLEALRYYRQDLSLADLEDYLRDRVPELSEHHWRPVQTPIFIIPSEPAYSQSIFPGSPTPLLGWHPVNPQVKEALIASRERTQAPQPEILTSPPHVEPKSLTESNPPTIEPPKISPLPAQNLFPTKDDLNPLPPHKTPQHRLASSKPKSSAYKWDAPRWSPWAFWGGSTLLALIIALLFFLSNRGRDLEGEGISSNDAEIEPSEENTQPESALIAQARTPLAENSASTYSDAINIAREVEPKHPDYEEAQRDISFWSRMIFDIAFGRANAENYQGAIAAAILIPDSQSQLKESIVPLIESWEVKAQEKENSQVLVSAAQDLITPSQASSYNDAVAILEQITPDQPGYEQARRLTEEWGQQIYLIANSRAAQGNYRQAIITAGLVPEDTSAYTLAQSAIREWQNNP